MTNDQKQKVMQLLELCIDNSKASVAECFFTASPTNYSSVSVSVRIGTNPLTAGFDESYSAATCYPVGPNSFDHSIDAAIVAIRTLPERAPALLAAKEAARREKLIKEYEEVFGDKKYDTSNK